MVGSGAKDERQSCNFTSAHVLVGPQYHIQPKRIRLAINIITLRKVAVVL